MRNFAFCTVEFNQFIHIKMLQTQDIAAINGRDMKYALNSNFYAIKSASPVDAHISYLQTKQISAEIQTSFFKELHKALLDLYPKLIRLSPEEAKPIAENISPLYHDLLTTVSLHDSHELTESSYAELYYTIRALSNTMIDIFEEIIKISNRPEIDENSKEYHSFLSNLALQAIKEDVNGDNALRGQSGLNSLFGDI